MSAGYVNDPRGSRDMIDSRCRSPSADEDRDNRRTIILGDLRSRRSDQAPTLELLQIHSLDVSPGQVLDMAEQGGRIGPVVCREPRDEGLETVLVPRVVGELLETSHSIRVLSRGEYERSEYMDGRLHSAREEKQRNRHATVWSPSPDDHDSQREGLGDAQGA
jgi:hypothetical protein